MQIANIDRILYFKHEGDPNSSPVTTMPEFQARYGFDPDGVNFYVGLSSSARSVLVSEGGRGLNMTHRAFFNSVVDALPGDGTPKRVILGLEPLQASDPFGYVHDNLDWVREIATELHAIQDQATASGKNLEIVLRFASEMNDRGNKTYGHRPDEFKAIFPEVRQAFRDQAPGIRFCFSPAIRVDLDESEITQYWPGDGLVDIMSGTWYVGENTDFATAADNMRRYVLHRLPRGLPFALDEMGGRGSLGNDPMLRMMFRHLRSLSVAHPVQFEYVTVFIDTVRWGETATLDFLITGVL